MKYISKFSIGVFALLFLVLAGCQDEKNESPAAVKMDFSFLMNGKPLALKTAYQNAKGEKFTVSDAWLYISDITLKDATGKAVYEDKSGYYVIQKGPGVEKLNIEMDSIPAGTYSSLEMTVGVDSVHNHDITLVESGLDPGRAWTWNTGYKFLSLEGTCLLNTPDERPLIYHIGLDQNLKTFSLDLTGNGKLVPGGSANWNVKVNLESIFSGKETLSFYNYNSVKADPVSSGVIADNYANGLLSW